MSDVEEARAAREQKIERAQRYLLLLVRDALSGYALEGLTSRAHLWTSKDTVAEAFMRLLLDRHLTLDPARIVHITIAGRNKLDELNTAARKQEAAAEDPRKTISDAQHKALLEAEITVQSQRIHEAAEKKFKAQEELRKINDRLNYSQRLRREITVARSAVSQSNLNRLSMTALGHVVDAAEAYLNDKEAAENLKS